jgi:hypothetical protein
MDRCTIVIVSNGTEVTVMMERALYIDSLRNTYEEQEVRKAEIKGENVSYDLLSVREIDSLSTRFAP